MTRVCVAGITGWTGGAVAGALAEADDLELVSGVSRSQAGTTHDELGVPILGSVGEALAGPQVDVVVDYTDAAAVKENVLAAIRGRAAVVVGSSGLTAEDFEEIDALSREAGVGVIAAGNFSLLAALLSRSAAEIARHVGSWEIVDYASAGKPDVPSGTARELAERLGETGGPAIGRPLGDLHGPAEARGATVAGTQVHSVRLPSFVVSTEIVFAAAGERLTLRHDAGESPAPYVAGTLLAVRSVAGRAGLTRGLDALLP
ncbi:MAG TPA: 4-hydroxy-tetrahydrodipicolinate reductase [Gaiellaceae bacterium]|nr:4-hydroxy-tetrahydrodipicolinate reductase [Gaiellaceae bacterium]